MNTKALAPIVSKSLVDPIYHIEKIQGCLTLESYQKEICEAISRYELVCVRSCHDLGKTFTAAKIVLWFGSSFAGSKIITSAPTYHQVKNLLWSEINAGHQRSKIPLGGRIGFTEWRFDADWFAIGITAKREAEKGPGQGLASTFQGWHAPAILVVFDEATGIDQSIWKQVEGLLTSGFVRFLCIGNPTSKRSPFYSCFKSADWHKIHLSCFDSPNFKANDINNFEDLKKEVDYTKTLNDEDYQERLQSYKKVHIGLLTLQWAVRYCRKWGITHPLVQAKVFGNFPEEEEDSLFKLSDIETAQNRDIEIKPHMSRYIGIDPADKGADKTVISVFIGPKQIKRIVRLKRDTEEVGREAINEINYGEFHDRSTAIGIDSIGIGVGVFNKLKHAKADKVIDKSVKVISVNVAKTDEIDFEQYLNLRAKIYQDLSDDIKDELQLLPESIYLEELPTIKFDFNTNGKLFIESKKDYKARTGLESPDDTDSLTIANHMRHLFLHSVQFSGSKKSSTMQEQKTHWGSYREKRARW